MSNNQDWILYENNLTVAVYNEKTGLGTINQSTFIRQCTTAAPTYVSNTLARLSTFNKVPKALKAVPLYLDVPNSVYSRGKLPHPEVLDYYLNVRAKHGDKKAIDFIKQYPAPSILNYVRSLISNQSIIVVPSKTIVQNQETQDIESWVEESKLVMSNVFKSVQTISDSISTVGNTAAEAKQLATESYFSVLNLRKELNDEKEANRKLSIEIDETFLKLKQIMRHRSWEYFYRLYRLIYKQNPVDNAQELINSKQAVSVIQALKILDSRNVGTHDFRDYIRRLYQLIFDYDNGFSNLLDDALRQNLDLPVISSLHPGRVLSLPSIDNPISLMQLLVQTHQKFNMSLHVMGDYFFRDICITMAWTLVKNSKLKVFCSSADADERVDANVDAIKNRNIDVLFLVTSGKTLEVDSPFTNSCMKLANKANTTVLHVDLNY